MMHHDRRAVVNYLVLRHRGGRLPGTSATDTLHRALPASGQLRGLRPGPVHLRQSQPGRGCSRNCRNRLRRSAPCSRARQAVIRVRLVLVYPRSPAQGWRVRLEFVICRVWRGWTTKDNAGAYERIVRGEVIPGIEARRIPGFRSIDLIRRERDHDVEFMTLMWFDTLDSVREFIGEDFEVAHVPLQAQAVLSDFDKRSAHYEVLDRRDQPL